MVLSLKPKKDINLLDVDYKIGNVIGYGRLIAGSINFMIKDWRPKSHFMPYFKTQFEVLRTVFSLERKQPYALFKKVELV